MEIKDDGTQTFSCKVPKFYLDRIHNTKVINPRWQDCLNGILAENTRVLKVSIQFESENEPRIYPFIIDKITNKRDKDFSVYKEISCNGLAFSELGKLGYKIELNSTILEQDFEKDPTVLATADYWLDKVFPNEKDENGAVKRWLTPWCYEIRMDWRGYLEEISDLQIDGGEAAQLQGYDFYNGKDASYLEEDMKNWLKINAGTSDILRKLRDSNKIYENPYISNWAVINGQLRPIAVEPFVEKARYIDCQNSNKYNITQTIAETFEIFCTYEYKCDATGHFVKHYQDENGDIWTGRKVIFFNRAIKTDNPLVINYQHNLQSISRIIDSSEVFTKMYVNPIQSETLDSGYVSIADTTLNPLLDDFILNFDYLYSVGSINDIQKQEIENYKVQLHQMNSQLIEIEKIYNDLIIQINELESDKAEAEAALESSQEQLTHYEKLRDSEVTNTPIIKNKTNSYSMWLVPQKDGKNLLKGKFELRGINQSSIVGKGNYDKEDLFPTANHPLITVQSAADISGTDKNKWYLINDEDGFPAELYTSWNNPLLNQDEADNDYFTGKVNGESGVLIYFELEYLPKNKYIAICQRFENSISVQNAKILELENVIGNDTHEDWHQWTGLKKDKKELEEEREKLLTRKEYLNLRFERIMGPALREGYWQPDNYEDPGQGYNVVLSRQNPKEESDTSFIFDEVLFEEEEKGYYYSSSEDYEEDVKTYYDYIRLDVNDSDNKKIYEKIGNGENIKLEDFCLTLQKTSFIWILQSDDQLKGNEDYYFLLDGKYYQFKTSSGEYKKNDKVTLKIKTNENETIKVIITRPSENNKVLSTLTPTLMTSPPTGGSNDPFNITIYFEGLINNLSTRHLYNKSGFIFSFFKINNSIIPVALLNNEEIDYSYYDKVSYSFNKNATISSNSNFKIRKNNVTKYPIVYPRFELKMPNVNRDSSNFKITVTPTPLNLTKFEDYMILQRKEKTYVTLKSTNVNIIKYIMNEEYNIIFQVSKANEKLYLDAKRVAKDSSKPKYSYEIQKANLPQESNYLELGQLTYINDYSVDVFKEYGYISGIKFQLDQPSKDQITVSNYKTKFEDLFSSISAQNEAMRQNKLSYNIAAAAFQSNGEVESSVLQNTLDNNDFAFSFSNTNISLDNEGGLVLTNTQTYSNGVYGQVALRGGGIFCSNSLKSNGERAWTTGITPDGIDASAIRTGRLDTDLVRIFSGNSLAFQWNSEGLYAFKELQNESGNGAISLDALNYIRFSKEGLLYINEGNTALDLGWNGLTISGAEGHIKLTSANGLQMFDDNNHALVTFGKHNTLGYGMFFTDTNGNVLLQATQAGNLQLVDTLKIGNSDDTNYAGLCGNDKAENEDPTTKEQIRIWAGSEKPSEAEFTVGETGAVKVSRLFIKKVDSNEHLELTYDKLKKLLDLVK